jgi:hypothetical protein
MLICNWLDMQVLGTLDTAMSDHSSKMLWLNILQSDGSHAANEWRHCQLSLSWLIMRSICVSVFVVNPKHCCTEFDSNVEAASTDNLENAPIGGNGSRSPALPSFVFNEGKMMDHDQG